MFRNPAWLMLTLVFWLHLATTASAGSISPNTPSASEDGFKPVDIEKVPSVNGKAHAIAAYAIVIIVLALYSFSLLRREKVIVKDLQKLKERLNKPPPL